MYVESIARTTNGPVRGRIHDGVHTFLGIRYGRDTGAARFLPPVAPEPWSDVANAMQYGPTCAQDHPDTGIDRALNPFMQRIGLTDSLPESEDCLFVNVWTRGVADGGARPVMVWVHSGGFATNSGSSPAIDGARLARTGDVVTVTFNHRLNVLGYTHLTDDPASPFAGSGNVGMLDIVFLLQWVRDNIAAFGGDPGNVTLFGQSGGAMKISALLAMPAAAGLFHRAILQSGAIPRVRTREEALAHSVELMELAGAQDFESLQRVDLQDLIRAYKVIESREGLTAFGSVVDGVVVPHHPFSPAATPVSADVPVIVGDLDTEASLFLGDRATELRALDRGVIADRLTELVGAEAAGALLDAVAHPDEDTYELSVRLLTDTIFNANTEEVARHKAEQGAAPVWRYRITWRTPVADGVFMSPHEVDVALTFGNIDCAAGLNGGGDDARRLSEILQAAWLAFARTGSPVNPLVPEWPAYSPDDAPVLTLGPEPAVARDVDGERLRAIQPFLREDRNWFAPFL